jgi:hypothetical protein
MKEENQKNQKEPTDHLHTYDESVRMMSEINVA